MCIRYTKCIVFGLNIGREELLTLLILFSGTAIEFVNSPRLDTWRNFALFSYEMEFLQVYTYMYKSSSTFSDVERI